MSKYKEEELEVLSEKIDEFSHTLYAAQLKKFDHVSEVYDTEKLSGVSLEELKTILRNKVLDHINKKNVNVHNVTPELLETLSREVVTDINDATLDKNNDLPLSFYGDRTYLPAPFLPNYYHIGHNASRPTSVHLIEDDDTWVGLTNTTDGSHAGVSWVYAKNVSVTYGQNVVRTSSSFRPHYIKDDETSLYVVGDSTAFVLCCSYISGEVNVPGRMYLVLTNGTLNPDGHDVVEITGKFDINGTSKLLSTCVYGEKLYLFTNVSPLLSYEVHSVLISGIKNKNVTFVKETGWNNIRPGLGNSTNDTIVVASSTDELYRTSGKDMTHHMPHTAGSHFTIESNVPGIFYLVTQGYSLYGAVDGIAQWTSQNYYIVTKVNLGDKQVNHPNIYGSNRPLINYQGSVITIEEKGLYKDSNKPKSMYDTRVSHTKISNIYLSPRRRYVRLHSHGFRPEETYITVSKFSEGDTVSDIVECNVNYDRSATSIIPHSNPTELSAPIGIVNALGDKALLVSSLSMNSPAILCKIPDDRMDYVYSSLTVGSRLGIPPNLDRSSIGFSLPKVISEVKSDKSQLTHGCYDEFYVTNGSYTVLNFNRFHSINNSGVLTATGGGYREHSFNYDRNQLVDQIITNAKTTVSHPKINTVSSNDIGVTLVVSKHIGLDKSIVTATIPVDNATITGRRDAIVLIYRCTVTMSGDVVTAVVLDTSSKVYQLRDVPFLYMSTVTSSTSIRQMANGELVIATHSSHYTYIGNNSIPGFMLKMDTSNKLHKIDYSPTNYNDETGLPLNYINFPNKGLYYGTGGVVTGVNLDNAMKMAAVKVCDYVTPSSFSYSSAASKINSGNGSVVILSVEAVDTWSLYFTQDVPCMINGQYGILPKTSFSLNPETDDWGEWNLWIHKDGNQFKYKLIKESTSQPDNNHLFIGYVHTKGKAHGVFNAVVEKSIAINGYRISRWEAGKSIPISEGPVNTSKHLNWV